MIKNILYMLLATFVVCSCNETPKNASMANSLPDIFPDYIDVTVPVDIAPLNFNLNTSAESIYVVLRGEKGGEMCVSGSFADMNISHWKALLQENKGADIIVSVYAKTATGWVQYRDFRIHVSSSPLDDYGLTYRLIAPGYEVGGDIGIYQRDIHSFKEEAIITTKAIPGQCMNCHTANRTDHKELTMQARGANGGTLIMKNGHQEWINTKTDSTRAAGSYAYWHPSGRYVAYAANEVHQSFFTGTGKPLEVYHNYSNIVVLDTETNSLLTTPELMTTHSLEIFPAFSADGKKIYYSSSAACSVPAEYEKVKCSIVSIDFDATNGTFARTDTILNARNDSCSYILARPSYDGKWLMYTRASRSNFPIAQPDADLWMLDIATNRTWPLANLNSEHSDSYHNWSSNSQWVVVASKREDGMYTRLYIAHIDENGHSTKPFLLPQRNPKKFYHELMDAYNCPDFTKHHVDFDAHEAYKQLGNKGKKQCKLR